MPAETTAWLVILLKCTSKSGKLEVLLFDQLVYCISSFKEAALSNDQKFEHVDISDKQKVINECSEAETWLIEKKQQQDALPKHANPVLLAADLKKKAETLDRLCKPIMMKPKPQTPPLAENPAPEPQAPEQQSNGANTAGEPASEGAAEEPAAEQMDTNKPDGGADPLA